MAITAQSANFTSSMLETVRPKLSQFLAMKQSKFAGLFNKAAEKHQVSAFTDAGNAASTFTLGGPVLAWRVPVLLNIGGDYQAISLDGGDLGTGSSMTTAFMAFGTFENDIGFNLPLRVIYATKSQQQAVANALQFTLGKAIGEMALYNEIGLFGDATGTLATANGSGAPANTGTVTYNLDTAGSYNRIRGYGALVDVYSTAGVLVYLNARVKSISFANNTITLTTPNAYGAGPVNTDVIAFPNMGQGAAVGAYTQVAGSWRNGIYTFNSTTNSGSLGSLAYSTAYEMATPNVNGQSGFFTPAIGYAGKAQLIQRRDEEAYSGVIGVCHTAQRVAWYLQGLTISNWFRGKADAMIDLAPTGHDYGDTFPACDVTHYVSRYALKNRVDWINPSNFGWTQLSEIDFIQTPDGQRLFIGRSTTTSNPTAGFQFYLANTRQLYSVDPGCGVAYYSLAIPSGQ